MQLKFFAHCKIEHLFPIPFILGQLRVVVTQSIVESSSHLIHRWEDADKVIDRSILGH